MTKKPSTSKVPAPISHVLNKKPPSREIRCLAALGQDKKKGPTPPKK